MHTTNRPSSPPPAAGSPPPPGLAARIAWELHELGFAPLRAFPLLAMLGSVFRLRHDQDIEQFFAIGTRTTTPEPAALDPEWPRPWIFLRVFVLFVVVYLVFYTANQKFPNFSLWLGMLAIGSLSVPFSSTVLMMELNAPRNVSLYRVLLVIVTGGFLSLVLTKSADSVPFILHIGRHHTNIPLAGIVEESAKALALMVILFNKRYPYTLNGMVFGAAVGTGFAVLETAGYALFDGLTLHSTPSLCATLLNKTSLSVLGHVAWTTLVGGALWHARRSLRFSLFAYFNWRFLSVLIAVTTLHTLWNGPLCSQFPDVKYLLLGGAAWIAIIHMLQAGLNEVRSVRDQAHGERA